MCVFVFDLRCCVFPEAAVPPWVGYNEEETIQQQILALSAVSDISTAAHWSDDLPVCVESESCGCDCRTRGTSCGTLRPEFSSTSTWSRCTLWRPSCWRRTSSSTACVLTSFPNSKQRSGVRNGPSNTSRLTCVDVFDSVKEEMFWRNYFYRVSLIKQSAQLTALAAQQQQQDSGDGGGSAASPEDVVLTG